MTKDIYILLCDIRDNVGLFAVMDPERLFEELDRRDYERSETVYKVMTEMRSHFLMTRTKPRLNELRNLSALISEYEHLDAKTVLNILNDLNDCIFPDTVRRL